VGMALLDGAAQRRALRQQPLPAQELNERGGAHPRGERDIGRRGPVPYGGRRLGVRRARRYFLAEQSFHGLSMNPPAPVAFPRVREDGLVTIGSLLLGAAALLAVHFGLLHTYWEYSEGVYALTAREILHGGDLYGHIVGAQPPGVFLAGVALLAVHDGLEWLRLAVACLQLGAGLIAARIVYRLSGSTVGAMLAAVAMVLTPWAVREHGALTPELISLPVMLGAALLAGDARRGNWAGALCGLLVLIKFPLAIPAVVLLALAVDRRRAALAAV